MSSKSISKQVGVVGAGSFGTAVANILAEKSKVLLYVRDEEKADLAELAGTVEPAE